MHAIVRQNTYDVAKLAHANAALEEFRAVHASQPGYLGSIEIDAGGGTSLVVNLWESKEAASAALPKMVPVVERLLEPLMTAPSKLLGTGNVAWTDLIHTGKAQ